MPKLKTNKSVKKRYRITKKGKILRHHAGKGHLLTGKSKKRKRALRRAALVDSTEVKDIRRLLPYG
ncbi:MAG: 50S ribosomal protein L35 [Deltaproteobacteria bacterium CG1_02_45_11]|nr:MAG: 50S ribosomal protein L35 [Deltaproteobacteria bacterium CG1_02_45_11]